MKKLLHSKIIQVSIVLILFLLLEIGISVAVRLTSDKQIEGQTKQVNIANQSDIYPNLNITPGSINPDITQDNISQNICNPNWSTKSERPSSAYTTELKKQQLMGWNGINKIMYASAGQYLPKGDKIAILSDYEEDHLISLELGGNPTDLANLWPEPYVASIPNGGAKSKDLVENYLHAQLCAGRISLAQAQKEISTDWYAVFKTMPVKLGSIANDPDDEDLPIGEGKG